MIITCTLVLTSSCLLKDFAQYFFLLSFALEFLVLHWIIPINKHAFMLCISKMNEKFLDPTSSSTYFLLLPIAKLLKGDVQLIISNYSTFSLESISNFLFSIPLKLLLSCSTMITMMLNPMANSQSSSYMTYLDDHVSQVAQDSLSFFLFSVHDY